MKSKFSFGSAFIHATILIAAFLCIFPLYLVVIVSISDASLLISDGIKIIPEKISYLAYEYIFKQGFSQIGQSYIITIVTTVIGTALAMLVTATSGYALVSTGLKHKNTISFFFFFSMLFSGGMVPWYLINGLFGLKDNIWALIVPGLLFNPYNMFLIRNYMKSLPISLMESARIDGANEWTIAFRLYIPLSVPVLAAVALFYSLSYWNSWWNAIMLINKKALFPLQYMLVEIRSSLEELRLVGRTNEIIPTQPIQNATTLLTIGPIILLYPFLQRYFIKGIVIGSIKG